MGQQKKQKHTSVPVTHQSVEQTEFNAVRGMGDLLS